MNMLIIFRALLLVLLLPAALSPAQALYDEKQIAAAKQAADEFLRKAEGAEKTGNMPRRSDPEIARLLDMVFDVSALGMETVPISRIGPIGEFARNGNRVGLAYILAGTGRTALSGPVDRETLVRVDQNTVTFAPELGQFMDFQLATTEAMARSALGFMAGASPQQMEQPQIKSGFAQMRSGLTQTLSGVLKTLTIAGLDEDWKRQRLASLERVAPTAARFFDDEHRGTLKRLAEGVGLLVSPELKQRLQVLADQFGAAPR